MVKIRKADVTITMVLEVDCKVCGQAVWPDDRILDWKEAHKVRDDHIAEHERGEYDK